MRWWGPPFTWPTHATKAPGRERCQFLLVLPWQCTINFDAEDQTEVKEDLGMRVGVDERGLVIEAIATLAYRKADMVNFILNPAGVPKEIYQRISNKQDDLTGRRITKRQAAPLILDALVERADYVDIVGTIVKIAANWEKFELCNNEYDCSSCEGQSSRVVEDESTVSKLKKLLVKMQPSVNETENIILARRRELNLLLAMFDDLTLQDHNAQERGYSLQVLLNRLFDAFEIPVYRSFTRNDGSEQIDGAFQIDGWYYLTECRWRRKPSDAREVDGLTGQLSRSGKQTMGVFLSINGWSENVPMLLKQSTEKAIILMQGYDLRAILSEEVDLRDYILAAVRNLNLYAEPYLGVREYLEQIE